MRLRDCFDENSRLRDAKKLSLKKQDCETFTIHQKFYETLIFGKTFATPPSARILWWELAGIC